MKKYFKLIFSKEFIKLFVSISLAVKLYVICEFLQLGIIAYRIILTFLIFTIFHAITFLIIRFFYSGIYDYINRYMATENMKIPKEIYNIHHKTIAILCIITIYLFSLILIFSVL